MRGNVEAHGWDGEWYRRAYFDDGSPLGSAQNAECQIDSIAQSWSALSGMGDPHRSRVAMDALCRRLVRRGDALVQLLAPAFAALGDSRRAWELMDMINPVNHGRTAEGAATYRVEPYVVAADVYAMPPHAGRGGWSWYTGSAAWMYRLIVESLLGLELAVDRLRFSPCLPAGWEGFELHYRYRETLYRITLSQSRTADRAAGVWVDGDLQAEDAVALVNDLVEHSVLVVVRMSSTA